MPHLVALCCSPMQLTNLRHFRPSSAAQPNAGSLTVRRVIISTFLAAAASLPLVLDMPSQASIMLVEEAPSQSSRARAIAQLGGQYAPVPSRSRQGSPSTSEQIEQGLQLLKQAREEADQEQYAQALSSYDLLLRQYSEFAFTEYARIERALVMYQLDRVSDALLQLEDEEVALRGYADVHAALAAVLYAERPNQITRAEQQWEIAMEFDRRYGNVEWVQQQKHWPPKALGALQRFLQLG